MVARPLIVQSEIQDYAPGIGATEVDVYRAMLQAEGPRGANRQLRIKQYKEEIIPIEATAQLSYLPVLTDPAVVVERQTLPGQWITLDSTSYIIDFDSGIINFKQLDFQSSNYLCQNQKSRAVRITYNSGFDFCLDTEEVIRIKIALGNMITFMKNNGGYQGIVSVNSAGEGSTRFDTGLDPGEIPDGMLGTFKEYSPIPSF